jgi:hypothetical protein
MPRKKQKNVFSIDKKRFDEMGDFPQARIIKKPEDVIESPASLQEALENIEELEHKHERSKVVKLEGDDEDKYAEILEKEAKISLDEYSESLVPDKNQKRLTKKQRQALNKMEKQRGSWRLK